MQRGEAAGQDSWNTNGTISPNFTSKTRYGNRECTQMTANTAKPRLWDREWNECGESHEFGNEVCLKVRVLSG